MSDRQTKKFPPLALRKGGVRKGGARTGNVAAFASLPPAQDEDCDVRKRTFPSETSRRLMATMAMVMDSPRALLDKRSGSGAIGLVDMLPGDVALLIGSDVDGNPALPSLLADLHSDERASAFEHAEAKKKRMPNPRKKAKYVPSKGQMASTFSKCLPIQDVAQFEKHFMAFQGVRDCPQGCDNLKVDPDSLIIKTRVVTILWALQRVYGVSNVVCEACDHANAGRTDSSSVASKHDYLEIVAMDAVLSRTLTATRRVTGEEEMDTPVKYRVADEEHLGPQYDSNYRAFVVVVPDGATYYCHRERRHGTIGVRNALIPMDTSWLRLVKNGDKERRFAKGGYVQRLWDDQPFWRFKIARGDSNFLLKTRKENPVHSLSWSGSSVPPLKVISAWQCADEHGPCLPPDFINGEQYNAATHKAHLKNVYRKELKEAKSSRLGCRHYVPGFLHRKIDPRETLVIDPQHGDFDIRVAIQVLSPSGRRKARASRDGENGGKRHIPVSLSRESVVHVRYLPNLGVGAEKLLCDIRDHSRAVTAERKDEGVRVGLGDQGNMHPVGTRIMLDKVQRRRYAASSKKCWQLPLKKSIVAAAKLASAVVPGILRIIQDTERDGGISPPVGGMSGDEESFCYVCHSLDISVDLANSSHYDSNDASMGFTIWTEDMPGGTKNWYFVLPNVYGKWPPRARGVKNGPTYQGIAIKLTHGTLISWDGRVIRHATSVVDDAEAAGDGATANHRYGNFFAAKSSVVAFGARASLKKKFVEAVRRCRAKSGDGNAAEDVGPLSTPIPRKEKVVAEAPPLFADLVLPGCKEDDACADDDGRSWCGHSYASDVPGENFSVDDDDHMSISDDGGELLKPDCVDDDVVLVPNENVAKFVPAESRLGEISHASHHVAAHDIEDPVLRRDDLAFRHRAWDSQRDKCGEHHDSLGDGLGREWQRHDHAWRDDFGKHDNRGGWGNDWQHDHRRGNCYDWQHGNRVGGRDRDWQQDNRDCGRGRDSRHDHRGGWGNDWRHDHRGGWGNDWRHDHRGGGRGNDWQHHNRGRGRSSDWQHDNRGGRGDDWRHDNRGGFRDYWRSGDGQVDSKRPLSSVLCAGMAHRPLVRDGVDLDFLGERSVRQRVDGENTWGQNPSRWGRPLAREQENTTLSGVDLPECEVEVETEQRVVVDLMDVEIQPGAARGIHGDGDDGRNSDDTYDGLFSRGDSILDGTLRGARNTTDDSAAVSDPPVKTTPDCLAVATTDDSAAVETTADFADIVDATVETPDSSNDEVRSIVSSLVANTSDETMLIYVKTPPECLVRCNQMWSLWNSQWIPQFNKADSRYAHPSECEKDITMEEVMTIPSFAGVVDAKWVAEAAKFKNACTQLSFSLRNCTYYDSGITHASIGWVKTIGRKGRGLKPGKTEYCCPFQLREEKMREVSHVQVPCEHMQLYFEMMMNRTLRAFEAVKIGFIRFSKKTTHYTVERVDTRTCRPLPSWEEEDCQSLIAYWDEEIIVEYHSTGSRDAGVLSETERRTSLRRGFTPSTFLGCSLLKVRKKRNVDVDFGRLLADALLKRMPQEEEIFVGDTWCEGNPYCMVAWKIVGATQSSSSDDDDNDERGFESD